MYKGRLARAAVIAMLAQGVSVAVSALTVFLLASTLQPSEYGLWQFYLLIGSYSGLFHLGLCDGVYLRLGGKRYEDLDVGEQGTVFRRMTGIQAVLAVLGVAGIWWFGGINGRGWAIALALAYMPLYNAAAYLGFVQQATDNTAVYSLSVVIERLSFAGAVVMAVALGTEDFRIYALCSIAAKLASLAYLVFKTGRLVFAPPTEPRIYPVLRQDISVGFRLMSANLAGQLITGAARLAVIYRYGDAAFGKVSFAMTLSGLFLQFMSQLTMVLFPTLRRQDGAGRRDAFCRLGWLARLLLPGVLLTYLPLKTVIATLLPDYAGELEYLILLLPLCMFDSNVHLVGASYLKVAGRVGMLWRLELTSAAVSLAMCFGAAYTGMGVAGILTAAVLAAVLRSLLFDAASGDGAPGWWRNTAGLLLSAILFVLTALLLRDIPAMLTYGALYLSYLCSALWRRGGLPVMTK